MAGSIVNIQRAVIDAGPLFSALTVSHVQNVGSRMDSQRLLRWADECVRLPDDQLRFLGILKRIGEKLTTSHVIGEINGLVKNRLRPREPELSIFWNGSIELLTFWNLSERLVGLLDFAPGSASEIARIGITDTGLIRLAQREGCVLITEDEKTLAPLAWEQGVDCRLLKSLL